MEFLNQWLTYWQTGRHKEMNDTYNDIWRHTRTNTIRITRTAIPKIKQKQKSIRCAAFIKY